MRSLLLTALIVGLAGPAGAAQISGFESADTAPYQATVFRNDLITLLNVDIPGKHETGYHTHSHDLTCVVMEDYPPEGYSQPLGGSPGTPRRATRGEVSYVSYFDQPPVTHRAVNPGTLPMHQICAQLNSAKPYGFSPQARPLTAYTQVLDNARVSAWRIVLEPGQSVAAISQEAPGLRVVVRGGDLTEVVSGHAERGLWLRPGNFYWQDAGATRALRNDGSTTIEMVEYEFK